MDSGSTSTLGVCCLRLIVSDFCVYLSIVFTSCYHCRICLLVWLLSSFFYYYYIFNFFVLIIYNCFYFNISNYYYFFISFFLPFLLSHVADRVLVLQPGVRPEPLRWESRVQDIGRQETSQPHIIPICESSPRYLHLSAKTQLHPTASKLQCWTPHAKQLA